MSSAAKDRATHPTRAQKLFTVYAWAFLCYLIGVVLFGAWVRITGSGAGCGEHWPTCGGEIIPRAPSVQTLIEYTHRLTSGMCGIFGLILMVWARRSFRDRPQIFKASAVTMLFIMLEGAVGAGLVLKGLVASDESVARAVVIAIHLVNTLSLVSSAALVAFWSRDDRPARASDRIGKLLLGALGLLIVVSMTGAITALGDTLFPVQASADGGLLSRIKGDLSATNHFLVRLRIVHPLLATGVALFIAFLGVELLRSADAQLRRWAAVILAALTAQVGLGLLNIALAAPGWLQLVHLLGSQVLWIGVLMAFVISRRATRPATP